MSEPTSGELPRPGVVGAGQAARTYQARGSTMLFKALAAQDDGDFSLMERTLPPRRPQAPAAPAHQLL